MGTWVRGYLFLMDKKSFRVFIRGLVGDTSGLELKNFFSTFGEVVGVRIVCDGKTGINKSHGFVTFATMQACDDLLKKGTVDYKRGRKFCVKRAVKKEIGGQFFASNGSCISSSNTHNRVIGGQIVVVPVVEQHTHHNTPTIKCVTFSSVQLGIIILWQSSTTGQIYKQVHFVTVII